MNKFRTADLFCGVGGLSLGFQRAGFDIAIAADNWEEVLAIYRENFKHRAVSIDLADVKATAALLLDEKVDVVVGGPPCQDFSHAGKREEGERANLTACFAATVAKVKPRIFVMENVERTKNSAAYAAARKKFKSSRYGLTEVVLDASLCGVPQRRKRFFCIGLLGEEDGALLETIERAKSVEPMTVRDHFGASLKTEFYYRHPRNYSRRAVYSLDEPSATIRGVNRPIPPNYPGHPADSASATAARPLTTSERAQIQTFPKDFVWRGSKTNVEQMIGNAVPPNLGFFVGSCVRRYIEEHASIRSRLRSHGGTNS